MKIFKTKSIKLLGISLLSLFIFATCADLVVENENSPKTEDVLASPTDIESLLPTGFVQWWQAATGFEQYLGVMVGIDYFTSSYGNADMKDRGAEPRIPYNNSPTATEDQAAIAEGPWYGMYGALTQGSDVIRNLTGPEALFDIVPSSQEDVSDADYTKMVIASAKYLQGLSLSFVGQYFDQGYAIDENSVAADLVLKPYTDVLALADQKLKEAADIAAALPANVLFGTDYISGFETLSMKTDFVQLVNTERARIKIYAPRKASEVAAVDWAAVKDLSNKGITFDFSPEGDDMFWYSYGMLYNNIGNWVRVDQRIIHMMDPTQPARYPATGTLGEASSDDARLTSDYAFYASSPFPPERGYYYHGHYISNRYPDHAFAFAGGPMPYTLKAENDLMYAEAVIRLDDTANKPAAVAKINETRVTRGNLAPVTILNTKAELLDAIKYERNVELYLSALTTHMADARRYETYVAGSLPHYPVPASELLLLLEDIYTFGGNDKVSPNNPYSLHIKRLDKSMSRIK